MSNWTGLSEETARLIEYRYEIRRLEVENSNLNKYIDSLRAEIERKDALINQALYYVDQNDIGGDCLW